MDYRHEREMMLADVLAPLALHYPQAGYTPAQLSVLAEDWCEDLCHFSPAVLADAVKMARRKEYFFPNVARMIEYAQAVEARRRVRHVPLPEPPVRESGLPERLLYLFRAKREGDQEAARAFYRILEASPGGLWDRRRREGPPHACPGNADNVAG